jgi:aconitate decarboxylase
MGLTNDIGTFLAGIRFGHLPDGAMPVVHTGFTDCVAVMIAGAPESVTRIVCAEGGVARSGLRGVLIGELKGSAPAIALVYGTAAHALDYDDTAFHSHPSAVLVSAILAEAAETGASGRDMALAYVAGYEVWAELILRDRDPHHLSGWHPTALFGTLGAAAASAVLRRQTAEQARTTIAIAASLAGGVSANFGTMVKPFHAGRAAQSGLNAARLSEAGLTAAPDAIEHRLGFLRAVSPQGNVDTETPAAFGRTWHILEHGVNVKLYPMCYGTHRILNGILDLKREHGLMPEQIAALDVELPESTATILRNHRPKTAHEAKFSAEFALAAGAIAGRCTSADLEKDFLLRADVQDFFSRVNVKPTRGRDIDRLTLTLTDGRTIATDVEFARGHFKRPAEPEALWQKFADCTSGALSTAEAQHLFDQLQHLEAVPSLAALTPAPALQGTG